MDSTSATAPVFEAATAYHTEMPEDETSDTEHDAAPPQLQLGHGEMRELLNEFKKLREEHAIVLALLQQKMLEDKNDEKAKEKALIEISQNITVRKPKEARSAEPFNDISKNKAPESTEFFEYCMEWLGATVKPLEERKVPLPQILLNTSMDDVKKGNQKLIYSLALGLSNEAWSFLQTEIKKNWPTEILDIVFISNGESGPFPRGTVILSDYMFNPRETQSIYCRFRSDLKHQLRGGWSRCGMFCQVGALWVDSSLAIFDLNIVAMILSALTTHREYDDLGLSFLAFHATSWPARERRMAIFNGFRQWSSIHFRSFVSGVKVSGRRREDMPMTGLRLEREHACFSRIGGENVYLSERRYSLAVKVHPLRGDPFGNFIIMALVDPWGESITERYRDKQHLKDFNLLPCRFLAGVAYFQCVVCIAIMQWSADWDRTLLRLEELIAVKVNDVDENNVNNYMYDNEQLERSRFYFTCLQLLRIFSEWIANDIASSKLASETNDAVTFVASNAVASDMDNAINIIERNWHVVLALHEKEGQALLDRIAQNIQTVESLRDGLFNAQSVREALKGTKLNRFLFVFTVVTIIFLPPSFVSTFYGMHLFDGVDGPNEQTQNQFWRAFISVTVVTYVLAGSALLGVQRYARLRNWLSKWWPKNTSKEQEDGNQTATSEGDATGSSVKNKCSRICLRLRRRTKTGADVEKANKGKGPQVSTSG